MGQSHIASLDYKEDLEPYTSVENRSSMDALFGYDRDIKTNELQLCAGESAGVKPGVATMNDHNMICELFSKALERGVWAPGKRGDAFIGPVTPGGVTLFEEA